MTKAKRRRRTRTRASAPKTPPLHINAFDTAGKLRRSDYRNVAIVMGLALGIRILFFVLHKKNNPLFYHPIMDALYHHEWALDILSGNIWGDDVFFRAPLYPYFLALLYKISGSSIAFAIFCQHLIGTASAMLVYVLARQFFVARVSLIAGCLAALYWPFIYFEGDLLIVTLIIFLNLLTLLLVIKSLRHGRWFTFVLSGIALGLSAIARPSILVLIPVLPLLYYLHTRSAAEAPGNGLKPWARYTIFAYAGVLLVVSPVLLRNYIVGKDIVPIASQGGVNFYIGNNPQSDGRTAIVPGTRWDWWGGYEDAILDAESAAGRPLKPSEVSNHYFRRGLGFMLGSPGESIPLLARKFGLFWAGGERANNKYIYFFWHKSGLGKVPLPGFWLVAPLGLAGGLLLWRRRQRFWLLYLFLISYMMGVVAFFVNARFRLPVVPVLIIFAAYGVYHLWHVVRTRRLQAWPTLALFVLCFTVIDLDFIGFRENKTHADSISHYTLGNAYLKMDEPDKAIHEYETALATYRKYPTSGYLLIARNVDYNLGRLYWGKGLCSRAIVFLERVGGDDQFTILAKEILADCYSKLGRYLDAARNYTEILSAFPDHGTAKRGFVDAMISQARVHRREGDVRSALEVLTRAQTVLPDDPTVAQEIESIKSEP